MTADTSSIEDMLGKFQQVSGRSIPDLVRAYARLACVQLANNTQSFTSKPDKGPAALLSQTKTVSFDIKKVIKDKESLRDRFEKSIQKQDIRDRLVKVLNAGRYDILAKIMSNVGMIHSESDFNQIAGSSSAGPIHKQYIRSNGKRKGRTYSPPGKVFFSTGDLEGYITEVSKRIGYAKGGWAGCAREIGGISGDGARGIPAYAKRHNGKNFSVTDRSSDKDEPHFTMTNSTPYIRKLLDTGSELTAMNIARERMIKSIIKVFEAATKKGSNIPATTKSETESAV
jgi:hypothetical protein